MIYNDVRPRGTETLNVACFATTSGESLPSRQFFTWNYVPSGIRLTEDYNKTNSIIMTGMPPGRRILKCLSDDPAYDVVGTFGTNDNNC